MTSEELTIYLRALQKQVEALKQSARWRLGHTSVRQVEKILGRKDGTLAIDHIESMISLLLEKQKTNTTSQSQSSKQRLLPLTVNEPQHIVFLVSHTDWNNKPQGDMFTALELGEALSDVFGWTYELAVEEADAKQQPTIVISLLFHRSISNRDDVTYIAWVRSYAEHWIMKPWFADYDVILCSSNKLLNFINSIIDTPAYLFPIATNLKRFVQGKFNEKYESDICFSGHKWSEPRIVEQLDTRGFEWKLKVFGNKWDDVDKVSAWRAGRLPYTEIPHAYASTRLVLDHANDSTLLWESVNSRVFDALGQGIPLVTNNAHGVHDLFEEKVPTYNSPASCLEQLNTILSGEYDHDKFKRLQTEIKEKHTYHQRATTLNTILANHRSTNFDINIVLSVDSIGVADSWGDYHFANSLANSLSTVGNRVNIILKNEWDRARQPNSLNIVLRGIHRFEPAPNTRNILWLISHPNKITSEELNQYDHIFIASENFVGKARSMCKKPCEVLHQCTDPEKFYPRQIEGIPSYNKLYVANSRGMLRTAVQYAINSNTPLSIFGADWEGKVPMAWIQEQQIPNHLLAHFYHTAGVVVNDHWLDMLDEGFISNRIFDVLACGGQIATENTPYWPEDFPIEAIIEYDESDFSSKLTERKPTPILEKASAYVRANHTFDHRAAALINCIDRLQRSNKSA